MKYEKVPAVGLCIYPYNIVKHLILFRAFGILKFLKLVQGADRGQTIKLIFWQSADYLFPVTFLVT